jgi:hypothetical protein
MKWLKRIFWLVVIVITLPCLYFVLFMVRYAYAGDLVTKLAYDMRPPQYPNSILVRSYEGGGNTFQGATQIYYSDDPVEVILEYYDREMPDRPEKRDWRGHPAYMYFERDVSQRAINATCWQSHTDPCEQYTPSLQVVIYRNEEFEEGSLIEVTITYALD